MKKQFKIGDVVHVIGDTSSKNFTIPGTSIELETGVLATVHWICGAYIDVAFPNGRIFSFRPDWLVHKQNYQVGDRVVIRRKTINGDWSVQELADTGVPVGTVGEIYFCPGEYRILVKFMTPDGTDTFCNLFSWDVEPARYQPGDKNVLELTGAKKPEEFSLGDRVILEIGKSSYGPSDVNPYWGFSGKFIPGTVKEIKSGVVYVSWDNEKYNSYTLHELTHLEYIEEYGTVSTWIPVGTRVVATDKNEWVPPGTCGTVVECDYSGMPYKVDFGKRDSGLNRFLWVRVDEIEQAQNTTKKDSLVFFDIIYNKKNQPHGTECYLETERGSGVFALGYSQANLKEDVFTKKDGRRIARERAELAVKLKADAVLANNGPLIFAYGVELPRHILKKYKSIVSNREQKETLTND